MSKKSKLQAKDLRRANKRARKAAEKAKYMTWRDEGKNGKSKRNRLATARSKTKGLINHPLGDCGNVGCKRCNPAVYNIYPWYFRSIARKS